VIEEILKNDRNLRIAWKGFEKDAELYTILEKYINDYLLNTGLSSKEVVSKYYSFLRDYMSCCSIYQENGKYPFQYREIKEYERVHYDIALLLSLIVSEHRYKIIKHLYTTKFTENEQLLIVGLGSGIEMDVILKSTQDTNVDIDAYDTAIGKYVKSRFKDLVNLCETTFNGSENKYDSIIAIELLEHLPDPIAFLKDCSKSLVKGGRCMVTTSTNMPQEDHLFNFDDLEKFEKSCQNIGLEIYFKEDIVHKSSFSLLNSKNTWYTFTKL